MQGWGYMQGKALFLSVRAALQAASEVSFTAGGREAADCAACKSRGLNNCNDQGFDTDKDTNWSTAAWVGKLGV